MRYLSTLLLTTTILTTTHVYGGLFCCKESKLREEKGSAVPYSLSRTAPSNEKAENSPTTRSESVINAEPISTNILSAKTVITPETEAAINKFKTIVTEKKDFNVSEAIEILFSPELFPFISSRSKERNENVFDQLKLPIADSIADSISNKTYNLNMRFTMLSFIAITSSNYLESIKGDIDEKINGIDKHTWLNELVSITTTWGGYSNVLDHYQLTFMLELRLKLYLELLHQTNITPDSLGQILRTTTELTKMFMTAPQDTLNYLAKSFKIDQKNFLPTATGPNEVFYYPESHYPSLSRIQSKSATEQEKLALLSEAFQALSNTLTAFEQKLDSSIKTSKTNINRVHANFGENPIDLFKDIFHRIATHTSTKPKDIIESFERLIQAGGSSDTLVNACTHLANNSNLDVKNRLFAAKILLENGSKETAFTAYSQIKDTVENTEYPHEDFKRNDSTEVIIGLHKAAPTESTLGTLGDQFKQLITNKESINYINTSNLITMAEILFNAERIQDKDTVIELIRWTVHSHITIGLFPEAMILGAETAERMKDFAASREFLSCLKNYGLEDEFKDRVIKLEATLSQKSTSN